MRDLPQFPNKYIGSGNKLLSLVKSSTPVKNPMPQIKYFDKRTFDFVGEADLMDVHVRYFKKIFGLTNNDPMLKSYPITNVQKKYMERLSGLELDLDKFDNFMEC